MTLRVENLDFTFPNDWEAIKFDDTVFYRCQFNQMRQSIKAVDLIAVDANGTAYLIEVKDYRLAAIPAPKDLPEVVSQKVFDTLAAQIPCKLNANEESEKRVALRVCTCTRLIVVLHVEQPTVPSGIFRPYDLANIQQKLRQLLKPVHAHPWVLQMGKMSRADWTVA